MWPRGGYYVCRDVQATGDVKFCYQNISFEYMCYYIIEVTSVDCHGAIL